MVGEIYKLLVTLFLRIDSIVYGIISVLYQVFIAVASLKMFNDGIYSRIENMVYMIVGVFALFLIAYNLLKHMIDADLSKSATDVKKVVLNLVTSMFMIMLIPITFNLLFSVQNAILKQDLIGKLFQPYTTDFENSEHLSSCLDSRVIVYQEDSDSYVQTDDSQAVNDVKLKCYGNLAALQMFQGFFYPAIVNDPENIQNYQNGTSLTNTLNEAAASVHPEDSTALEKLGSAVKWLFEPLPMKVFDIVNAFRNSDENDNSDFSLADAYDVAVASGDFAIFELFTENVESGEIKYTFLASTIAGGFACYVLLLYCLDVAVRAVKLAFYQMIAPFPIMMRVVPKKGTEIFNNWLKCVSTTYFEIFSRLAILYFGMFFVSNIFTLMGEGLSSKNIGYNLMSGSLFGVGVWLLVKAVIILGIFAFMKKLPELLKQIVPSSDKFSLKLWDHLKDSFAIPAAIGGFAGGMVASGGNPLAGIRAAGKGWKDSSLAGIGAEHKRRLAKLEADKKSRAAGQSTTERMAHRMLERGRGYLGLDSGVDELNRKIDRGEGLRKGTTITAINDSMDNIQLLDSESHHIGTINRGDTRIYDKDTKTNAETSLEMWKRRQSDIKEIANKYDETASGMRAVASSAKAFDDVMESKLLKGDSKYTLQYSMFKDNQGKYHVVYGVDENDFKNNLRAKLNELGYADGDQKDALINSLSESSSIGNLSTFQNYTAGFLRKHDGEDLGNSYDEINQSGTKAMDALKKLAERELILGDDNGTGRMIKAGQGSLNTLINNIVAGKLLELQATRDVDGTITSATLDRLSNIQVGSYTLDLTAPGFESRLQAALRNGQFTADELISALKNLETAATNVETEKTSDAGKINQRLNEADSQVKAHTRFIETGNKAIDIEKRGNVYTAQQATTDYINKTKGGNSQ